ncbi:MAG: 2-phospho-L-lactate transferase [Actinomycetota bacterium]|nr:2-phospho-L-lactate transferase [Actinomycetota bacterium]
MVEVVHPADVTAIVNTGDDFVIHGLAVSPDLDTVTYTLADVVNVDTGWGLAGETWGAMDALDRFGPELTWFRLGDRDLATHLYRTRRRGEGAPLSTVTAEIGRAFGVGVQLLPATDDPVATRVDVSGEGEIDFQYYFVRRRHDVPVRGVRFDGADVARPGPGVLEALAAADRVVICPSNPIVSIDPILAVPGVRDAVVARRDAVVAVSPIVAGAALKGPAARLLADLGHDVSVVGVARLYAPLASVLVVDEADRWLAGAVEDEGLRCVVAPAVMRGRPEAVALAAAVLGA